MKGEVKDMGPAGAALTGGMKVRLTMALMGVRRKASLMCEFTRRVNEQNLVS